MTESSHASIGQPEQQTGKKAAQQAKQQTGQAAQQTRAAAGETAGTAGEQARTVTHEAREQARTVTGDLRERAAGEAQSQTHKTADWLRQWAGDLSSMADSARPGSPARGLVSQAADGSRRAADTLEERGIGGLVEGLETFARRRPGTFLGGAALAGFVVGRLAKSGAKARQSGPDGHAGNGHGPGHPAAGASPAGLPPPGLGNEEDVSLGPDLRRYGEVS